MDLREAPYLEILFRKDFLQQMHNKYGYIGYPGLLSTIRIRV
jgi:hypothetical protein